MRDVQVISMAHAAGFTMHFTVPRARFRRANTVLSRHCVSMFF